MEKSIDPEYEKWKRDEARLSVNYVNSLFRSLERNLAWAKSDIENLEKGIIKCGNLQQKTFNTSK